MTRPHSIIARALLAISLALGLTYLSAQQMHKTPDMLQQPIGQHVGGMSNDFSVAPTQEQKMAHWSNTLRQKQLVKDSAKLVELTDQFKQRMATRGNRSFNDDDLKLIAQIEKLAHSIREGMAYAGEAPRPVPPPPLLNW